MPLVHHARNPLKVAVLLFSLLLYFNFYSPAYATEEVADEAVIGQKTVALGDGGDTSANGNSPVPDLFTGTIL